MSRTSWKPICLFSQYIGPKYIPGTVLVSGDTEINEILVPTLRELVWIYFIYTINSICYVPVTSLSAFRILANLITKTTICESYIIIPIYRWGN